MSSDDCYLYFRFKRSHDFYEKFKDKKDYILKARQRAKEEKEYAELKALRERDELALKLNKMEKEEKKKEKEE